MFCKQCGNEIADVAVVCTKCGVATDNFSKSSEKTREVFLLTGGYVASVLVPIVGFIFGIVFTVRGKTPHGLGMIGLSIVSGLFWLGVNMPAEY